MNVAVNPGGPMTVSCDGSSAAIDPPAPAPSPDSSAGGAPDPGAVSALIAAQRRRAEAKPGEKADASV